MAVTNYAVIIIVRSGHVGGPLLGSVYDALYKLAFTIIKSQSIVLQSQENVF